MYMKRLYVFHCWNVLFLMPKTPDDVWNEVKSVYVDKII